MLKSLMLAMHLQKEVRKNNACLGKEIKNKKNK
jgi:hypothetical protein